MMPAVPRGRWGMACLLMLMVVGPNVAADDASPVMRPDVEETVARTVPPENGAGPLWSYGAPLLVRQGDRVFTSVMETGKDVPRLCNTRWRLFRRGASGWDSPAHAVAFREREPCPLVLAAPDRLLLSVNPSTQPPGTEYGPCDPHLLRLSPEQPAGAPAVIRPAWTGHPHFTDHSYRGIAADRTTGGVLLLNIDATTSAQHWSYAGASGLFSHSGQIRFPIRSCYPQVALQGRAAHVLAIGDIVEPRAEWLTYKRDKTGQAWDYVFRRLFYAWTPDITKREFAAPVEIDSVEATGGSLVNLDLWLDRKGVAHLLYLKSNMTPVLRDRFFSGERIVISLEHVQVSNGRVIARSALVTGGEGREETPQYGRLHATPEGKLVLVYATRVRLPGGAEELQNRLLTVLPRSAAAPPIRLWLRRPLTTFFTATERGGSRPSRILDLFGDVGDGSTLRYARFRLP
jgi:hypothetical protein